MANFERDDYTRIYDHGTKSVYEAVSLPWTWRFILTRFNRKHILCDRSLPRADRARKCLDELGWKIEWKHHFQKHASEILPLRVPYQRTAVFSALPCPPLRSWLHRLKSTVLSVLQEDRPKGMDSTAHVNTFPMIRWVLRRTRGGGWTLLPNDKEPGFSFLRHSETREIAISSLIPGSYTETHFDEMQLPRLMKAYCSVAKRVGELHGERTQSAALSSQWCEGATAISQIRLLCKTTKCPGEVTFRCVHSGVSHMWTGLSAWLAHHLREKIARQLPHLLRDTKDFVDVLRCLHWQENMCMVKIDIKEFYMSGEPGFLSRACSELFCDETGDFQQLVAKAVDWLCRHQFVQSEFLIDLTYKVIRGSGMGLLHSGEVSDAGFWVAAERWLLNTSGRRWCSITYWRRFRDDIFAITNIFLRFKHVFGWLRSRAAREGFKLLAEAKSHSSQLMSWWSMAVS